MNSVAATAQSARRSGAEVAPGGMLGRPDLSFDTIVTAAAERLATSWAPISGPSGMRTTRPPCAAASN